MFYRCFGTPKKTIGHAVDELAKKNTQVNGILSGRLELDGGDYVKRHPREAHVGFNPLIDFNDPLLVNILAANAREGAAIDAFLTALT
ncbi:hypothetical protein PsorP6_002022 [Peronosclerospora sorghi]|uniref:Uncharacterized protein n=1 Tax=Peronosclerospora sorghi TaxID=230839 RepID=A0ACC0WVK7_9STRA|nr:hypothetical protein PsorP6_002022 [Peronosclerospora sorghi]